MIEKEERGAQCKRVESVQEVEEDSLLSSLSHSKLTFPMHIEAFASIEKP